jgi:hypothetical protein
LLLLFAGCEEIGGDDDNGGSGAKQVLTIAPTSLQAPGAGGTYTLDVTATQAWSADAAATWCSVTPAFHAGSRKVTASIAANPTVAARTTSLTFTSGTLTQTVAVTQAAGENTPATCNIESFTVNGTAWTISDTTITCNYPEGTAATTLTPVITVSPGATVTPA